MTSKHSIFDDESELSASNAKQVVVWIIMFLLIFVIWSLVFEVEEVSSGTGKVIPSSREQVLQSLEGGILAKLNVTEGDIVKKDQILAQLDATRTESNVEETAARYRAALASVARLDAELTKSDAIDFPEELNDYPELCQAESELFRSRQVSLHDSLKGLNQSLILVNKELLITQNLLKTGAASNVELLRLQRQRSDIELKIAELQSEREVKAQEELVRANAEVQALSSVIKGRVDSLSRLTLRSPVRGIVKDIEVSTIGGVIPPNGRLMIIVPLDEQLLIEARISPRDIAFIHPDQRALVKITAYDYSIYGGLEGDVVMISPDSIRDEVKPEIFYYRVFIRTNEDALKNKAGQRFPIVPGMVATVDIKTGSKTIWQYLIKPVNRASEALRER
ncbi:TPA: HlyD family efflux transporter periplasmic adaptor subunit [Providencia rettgeri]|nr:HlyD family efflux transporter periplasmic adaptor subunit [Providencia rettgeri]